MFGLAKRSELDNVVSQNISLARRIKLLEKHLHLVYNEGNKRKAHYKVVTKKMGRPRKTTEYEV